MTHKEYNGWTNYETWLVKLWIDNEQGSQDYWIERAEQNVKDDEDGDIRALAEELKDQHEEMLPKLEGFAADLMNAALSEVNWEEIANSLIEDAKQNLAEV